MLKLFRRLKRKCPVRRRRAGSGAGILFFMGATFAIFGSAEAIRPIPFHSSGGVGKTDWGKFTPIYNEGQSRGFGFLFILMGLLFLYWGYCVVRNAKNE
jgi:hypothetical protein